MSGATETKDPAPDTNGTQALAPASPGAVPSKVSVRLGIAPTTLDEGWRLAQALSKSELVPKNFRGRPEDILVAVQMGMELGLPPLAALSSVAVINGRASLWGDGFMAVLMSSPLYADHDEYYEVGGQRRDGLLPDDLKAESTAAVCTFWRQGKRTPVTRHFSIAQAKKAGLWGKSGPWTEYPDRMLSMRARGFAGRDAFPDLLRGIRTAEEALDAPPDLDVEPVKEVRRLSETKAEASTPPKPVPAAREQVTLGPAAVKEVQQAPNGYLLILDTGEQIGVEYLDDATDLQRFAGATTKLKVVCERFDPATLVLKSFAVAE